MAQIILHKEPTPEQLYTPVVLDTDKTITVTMSRIMGDKGLTMRCSAVRDAGEKQEELGNAVYNEGKDYASVSMNTLKGLSRETVLEALSTMADALSMMNEDMK